MNIFQLLSLTKITTATRENARNKHAHHVSKSDEIFFAKKVLGKLIYFQNRQKSSDCAIELVAMLEIFFD
jgi:hypothetical protein